VNYGDRTVEYHHYWGGVMAPMGYSPWPFYTYHYFWWLPFVHSPYYVSPYYGPGPVYHAGFLGTLLGIIVLVLVIWLAVKIIQALARLFSGGGGYRAYR